MTFLTRIMGNTPANDERAWTPTGAIGAPTASGQYVSPQTALKISTFWACVDLLASSVGMLPAVVYKRLPNGGRERATDNPLYDVLHNQPNAEQTPFEFFQMMTAFAIVRKKAYARIKSGLRGAVDQIIPLHPDRVREQTLAGGGVRYIYTPPGGTQEPINGEDMFVLRRFNLDGSATNDLVDYARESLGVALAARQASARLFGNDSRPVGVLQMAGKLSKEGKSNLKASWEQAQSGVNYGRVAVLEEGLTWNSIGLDPKEAQFFEREEFQAQDICRWLRVPPTMVGIPGATMWGSGVEQLGIGFVTYTLMPLLVSWQQAAWRDLMVIDPDNHFVEFLTAALLRGDTATRFAAYATASGGPAPWMLRNEVRAAENMNPIDGLDEMLQPANMGTVGEEPPAPQFPGIDQSPKNEAPPEPAPESTPEEDAMSNIYLRDAAARVVRKEITAMKKAHAKGDWAKEVGKFYADHVDHVARELHISDADARAYCDEQVAELMAGGIDRLGDWETRKVDALVGLVAAGQSRLPAQPAPIATLEKLFADFRQDFQLLATRVASLGNPVVHVMPPAPNITVESAPQPAPVVNVAGAKVEVAAPDMTAIAEAIRAASEQPAPVVNVTTVAPDMTPVAEAIKAAADQPAPVVNVINPDRKIELVLKRNKQTDQIVGATGESTAKED